MKVFISSVIGGFESYRDAAAQGTWALGHDVIKAEDFGASPASPQQVCLRGVRDADVVVLLVGQRYGHPQASGLSATHEEYREAQERCRVFVFVQTGVEREPAEKEFLREVQAWSSGHYTENFSSPQELRDKVTRALHQLELAQVVGPVDEKEMLGRAEALLPSSRGGGRTSLFLVVVGGPRQQVIRPAELEGPELKRAIQQEALFGEAAVFDDSKGTQPRIEDHALHLTQADATITVDELGSVRFVLPALAERDRGHFTGWLLDRTDPMKRLADVVIVAGLSGAGYLPWRTRAEHQANPNQATMGKGADLIVVHPSSVRRNRAVLTLDAGRIAEDLTILLRREVRP